MTGQPCIGRLPSDVRAQAVVGVLEVRDVLLRERADSVEQLAPDVGAREDDPFDKLPPDLQKVRLWLDVRLWEESDPSKAVPEDLLSWRKEFLTEFDATDAGKKPPLGALPVVVIASDPAAPESARRSRDEAGPRLDYLSSNTVHITAAGSGHEIHLYQPDRVIQGVLQAVSAVRTGRPLAPQK